MSYCRSEAIFSSVTPACFARMTGTPKSEHSLTVFVMGTGAWSRSIARRRGRAHESGERECLAKFLLSRDISRLRSAVFVSSDRTLKVYVRVFVDLPLCDTTRCADLFSYLPAQMYSNLLRLCPILNLNPCPREFPSSRAFLSPFGDLQAATFPRACGKPCGVSCCCCPAMDLGCNDGGSS